MIITTIVVGLLAGAVFKKTHAAWSLKFQYFLSSSLLSARKDVYEYS